MSVVMNYPRLYADLNRARIARGISWNKLAVRAGMAPSGMANFVKQFEAPNGAPKAPKALSVENLIKLMHWMGKTNIADYTMDEAELDGTI